MHELAKAKKDKFIELFIIAKYSVLPPSYTSFFRLRLFILMLTNYVAH